MQRDGSAQSAEQALAVVFYLEPELCVTIMWWTISTKDQKHPPFSPFSISHSSQWEEFRTNEPFLLFNFFVSLKTRNKTSGICSYCNLAVKVARIHYYFAQIHYSLLPNIHYSRITFFLGPPAVYLFQWGKITLKEIHAGELLWGPLTSTISMLYFSTYNQISHKPCFFPVLH